MTLSDKPNKLPDFSLPPSLPDKNGVTNLPQFSLTNDRHPMSMPVRFIKPKVQNFKPNNDKSNNLMEDKSDKQSVTSVQSDQSNLLSIILYDRITFCMS